MSKIEHISVSTFCASTSVCKRKPIKYQIISFLYPFSICCCSLHSFIGWLVIFFCEFQQSGMFFFLSQFHWVCKILFFVYIFEMCMWVCAYVSVYGMNICIWFRHALCQLHISIQVRYTYRACVYHPYILFENCFSTFNITILLLLEMSLTTWLKRITVFHSFYWKLLSSSDYYWLHIAM